VIFRDEARDPVRVIPRAAYVALALIGVFYTVSSWSVVSSRGDAAAVEAAAADPGRMVITSMTDELGSRGGDVAEVLLVTSLFAAILSFHNVLARYLFVLGNSTVLPEFFGRSHPRHGSPYVASLAQAGCALTFLLIFAATGMDPVTEVFAWMAGTATLGVLALMALTCAAVLVFFRRTRVDDRLWHTVLAPLLGLGGLLGCLWLTVANFELLIGGSGRLALALLSVPVLALVGGALRSRQYKRRTTGPVEALL
jgi:amino acid transporter